MYQNLFRFSAFFSFYLWAAICSAQELKYPLRQDNQALYETITSNQDSLLNNLGDDGLTLFKVLEYGLSHNTSVLQAQLGLTAVEAAQISAKGEFDPNVSASVTTSQNRSPYEQTTAALLGYSNSDSISDSAFVSLSKKLRKIGTDVGISADVSRFADQRSSGPDSNNSSLRFQITQPLLKGAGADVVGASEKAAALRTEAQQSRLVFSLASTASQIINNFWSYVDAHETLGSYQSSLERLNLLSAGFDELVAKGIYKETEKSTISAAIDELESKILAAQDYVRSTRDSLGRSIGVSDAERTKIPAPSYNLLRPKDMPRAIFEKYLAYAKDNRADLVAEQILIQGTDIDLKKRQNDILPNLDLVGSVGRSRVVDGKGFSDSFTSLYDGNAANSWSVGLAFSYPIANHSAEGALLQEKASILSQKASLYDLERSLTFSVSESYDRLKSLSLRLVQTEKTFKSFIDLYRKQVESIQKGSSEASISDVLQTEQSLTDSEISLASLLVRYYQELASFRYETGTLIGRLGSDQIVFDQTRLMTSDFIDEIP
jgi:outer membrane protein